MSCLQFKYSYAVQVVGTKGESKVIKDNNNNSGKINNF